MSNNYEILLQQVETVKNILVAHATGQEADEESFKHIRLQIVRNPLIKDKLPRCVHTCRTLGEFWGFIKEQSGTYAGRRKLLGDEFHPVIMFLEQSSSSPADEQVSEVLSTVDSANVHVIWKRALERRATDPEGAITLARTLIEAVCKYILNEQSIEYSEKDDLPKLYGLVASSLNLSPAQHTERIFKQILGGCHSIVQGLGALRSKHGDAHASGTTASRPALRHAELAVNLAGAMATFLISTWEVRKE